MRPDDAFQLIRRPHVTEKTLDLIEKHNTIVFIVKREADKGRIKDAVETLYGVKVDSVNTANTHVGKKAFVKLVAENSASDLASKLGVL